MVVQHRLLLLLLLRTLLAWSFTLRTNSIGGGGARRIHKPARMAKIDKLHATTEQQYISDTTIPVESNSTNQEQDDRTYSSTATTQSNADRLRQEAQKIRLQASLMDMQLTLTKIAALEQKIKNKSWLDKNGPEQYDNIVQQVNALRLKVKPNNSTTTGKSERTKVIDKTTDSSYINQQSLFSTAISDLIIPTPSDTDALLQYIIANNTDTLGADFNISLSGYDAENFVVYYPVALEIEQRNIQNFTIKEQIEALITSPSIQLFIQQQLQNSLIQPFQDITKLEELQRQFLSSTSRVERDQIKREIATIEAKINNNENFSYSESINLNMTKLSTTQINDRINTIKRLPQLMQVLLKRRIGLNATDNDLELLVLLDYYEDQLQILDQLPALQLQDDESLYDAKAAIESLPELVRQRFYEKMGIEANESIDKAVKRLNDGGSSSRKKNIQVSVSTKNIAIFGNMDDLDYIDRSRGLAEMYPFVTRMAEIDESVIDQFYKEVIDKKAFMVENKPERVMGGYYVRGQNLLDDSYTREDFNTATKQLIERTTKRLESSSIRDKVRFFYIADPSLQSDEDVEMGNSISPIFLVTAKNDELIYQDNNIFVKGIVNILSLFLILVTALGTSSLPYFSEDTASVADIANIISYGSVSQIAGFILATVFAHEAAHYISAWKNNFRIGLPTLIPSLQFGIMGAITPLKSPPPSNSALFDFAMSGPLFGLVTSLAFLVTGLDLTANTDFSALPVFPAYILQSSALGGGLIELFLGKGTLSSLPSEGVQALHPLAIAGFIGTIVNALALLPFGHTDGGRIAMTMFGRRGAYIINFFTLIIVCVGGLVGLDQSGVLLQYALLSSIWQKDLETPAVSEVEQLELSRVLAAIATSVIVGLTLLPMV